MTPLVRLDKISKRFSRIQANDNVSLAVEEGRIHGLVGGNGAGKSTLMKILYGMYQPDSGEIYIRGNRVRISHPADAIRLGMGMLHQDFLLIENMDAVENIILGAEIHRHGVIDRRAAERKIGEMASEFDLDCDLRAPVAGLSVGVRQRVEILKILFRNARFLILDEPTSFLVPHEVDSLFVMLRRLKESGCTIVFVSHKLREVLTICDSVSVMRDGKMIFTENASKVSIDDLVEKMTGETIPQLRKSYSTGEKIPQFQVKHLTIVEKRRTLIDDVSFTVNSKEILGIAGIEGNGQRELEEGLMGLRHHVSGSLTIGESTFQEYSPSDLLQHGVGYIPSDRLEFGVIGEFSLAENVLLGYQDSTLFAKWGLLSRREIGTYSQEVLAGNRVTPPDPEVPLRWLSGGNQQKLVVARVLSRKLVCLIACHPTRGVGVHDMHFIWQQLLELKNSGSSILLISGDFTELFAVCDRIAVMFKGKIIAEVDPRNISQAQLGKLMMGGDLQVRESGSQRVKES